MKKHIIAAAVAAAVAVPAMAQNVEVYGILDYSVATTTEETAAATVKTTNTGANGNLSGSRFGVKGSEDLGGGLKAIFQIEWGIDVAARDAVVGNNNRNTFVGFEGGFGRIQAGTFATLTKNLNDRTAFGGATFGNIGWVAQENGYENDRIASTIQYSTPTVNGFKGHVQYGGGTTTDTTATAGKAGSNSVLYGFDYSNGPLAVEFAAMDQTTTTEAVAPITTKVQQNSLRVAYNFGIANVIYNYNKRDTDVTATATAQRKDNTIGIQYPLSGSTTLLGQYGRGDQGTTEIKAYQIGLTHALSKRTTLYGGYGSENLETVAGAETDRSAFVAGLRHQF